MTHILISLQENPSISFASDLTDKKGVCNIRSKQWDGYDEEGRFVGIGHYWISVPYTRYHLINNCSFDEFNAGITSEKILFRVIDDSDLVEIKPLFSERPNKALNLPKILAKQLFELKVSKSLEPARTNMCSIM